MNTTSVKPMELNGPSNHTEWGGAVRIKSRKGQIRGPFSCQRAVGTVRCGAQSRVQISGVPLTGCIHLSNLTYPGFIFSSVKWGRRYLSCRAFLKTERDHVCEGRGVGVTHRLREPRCLSSAASSAWGAHGRVHVVFRFLCHL